MMSLKARAKSRVSTGARPWHAVAARFVDLSVQVYFFDWTLETHELKIHA